MIDKEKGEIWKVYPDYPFIEASNLGRIKTKDRYIRVKGRGKRLIKGRILRQRDNGYGYMKVGFNIDGKRVDLYVHQIVATCFLPNPNGYLEVNHLDCNPKNNAVSNLEWCSHQENIAYRDKLGRIAKHNAPKKPVVAVDQETFEVFWFESQHESSRQLYVSQGHISDVLKGRQNKTHDCWFCYADETAVENTRSKFGDEVAKKVEKLMNENCN